MNEANMALYKRLTQAVLDGDDWAFSHALRMRIMPAFPDHRMGGKLIHGSYYTQSPGETVEIRIPSWALSVMLKIEQEE